jgi:hypothetical protein
MRRRDMVSRPYRRAAPTVDPQHGGGSYSDTCFDGLTFCCAIPPSDRHLCQTRDVAIQYRPSGWHGGHHACDDLLRIAHSQAGFLGLIVAPFNWADDRYALGQMLHSCGFHPCVIPPCNRCSPALLKSHANGLLRQSNRRRRDIMRYLVSVCT